MYAWGGLTPSLPHGGMKNGEVVGGRPLKVHYDDGDDRLNRSPGIAPWSVRGDRLGLRARGGFVAESFVSRVCLREEWRRRGGQRELLLQV
jgi:hypothetical protein